MPGRVSYQILGILSVQPMSGYDIEKFVVEHLSYFWSESYGQIYPALKRMAEDGLVTVRKPAGKLDRQVYRITPRGRTEVRRWLAEPPQTPSPRNEMVLKLFFGHYGDVSDLIRHVLGLRQRHIEAMKQYEQVEAWLNREKAENPSLPFWLITVDYGKRYSKFLLEWSEATLEKLSKMENL
jgi:DNA-binding PadR family transcriptional regulator